jgi:Glycine rich protein
MVLIVWCAACGSSTREHSADASAVTRDSGPIVITLPKKTEGDASDDDVADGGSNDADASDRSVDGDGGDGGPGSCETSADCSNGEACMASQCSPRSAFFSFTGNDQTFVVPNGISQVTVYALGANGPCATSWCSTVLGQPNVSPTTGIGGSLTATIPVTPGETLVVVVGDGSGATGYGGGGSGGTESCTSTYDNGASSGGGASDVRQGGNGLANRVVVAGGGGGNGDGAAEPAGGAGGGLVGGAGGVGEGSNGGGPGTQSAGGAGGNVGDASVPGTAGSLGVGGTGASCTGYLYGNGGGGGGGYYGGGGGGMGDENGGGGGGGGGSSYAEPGATNLTMVQGDMTGDEAGDGNGEVVISW